ncbi:MAG TPA: A/G-specific adenine glycosylase [Terriglobales bacterium]|nr:A/G-specific adenine glycosylase [Terriglobales bacterium]
MPKREVEAGLRLEVWPHATLRAFRRRLLNWYDRNRRDLPWRGSQDPYRIWISEVMLQQTRVATVISYYSRFLERFPDLTALAAAKPEAVLAAWSGLGYYRRARALHEAAKIMVERHGGELPRSAAELLGLPGFGPYTAAAVASIAFGEPIAVVDGNVERVLAQLFAWQQLKRNTAWEAAQRLLSPGRPGDFNQAMMELGATVCLPAQAQCAACPLFRWCRTRGLGAAKEKERRRQRQLHYRLAQRGKAIFLVQRARDSSLMPGMWELPEVAVNGVRPEVTLRLRHSITVTDFTIEVSTGEPPAGIRGRWVAQAQVEELPLTGLTKKILRRANFI